jgi:hypothetical protein
MGNPNSLNPHGLTSKRFNNNFPPIVNSIIGDGDYIEMV